MQHISQTILKENKEVVNLILPKTSKNIYFKNSCEKCPLQGKPVQIIADFNIDLPKADTSNYSLESF